MRYISPEFRIFLDTFAASDGGARLTQFQANYDTLYAQAKEGDATAMELMLIFDRAAKMVELLSK